MDKIIWMCWFQGIDDKSVSRLNRFCFKKWAEINPSWKVNILDNETIVNYVPEYFDIASKATTDRRNVNRSDLLRILLLSKFGGVWADATLLPMVRLDDYIDNLLNDTGFFAYRFMPRFKGRETSTWFLATDRPNHYLINRWKEKTIAGWENPDDNWGSKSDVFQTHKYLSELYDNDEKIRAIIDNMTQIDTKIPHSASNHGKEESWNSRESSYMYKRPVMNKVIRRQLEEEWENEKKEV